MTVSSMTQFVKTASFSMIVKTRLQSWAVVAHSFNPSTWEAEAGRFLSLRQVWSTRVSSRTAGAIQRKPVSKKQKTEKAKQTSKQNHKVTCVIYSFIYLSIYLCRDFLYFILFWFFGFGFFRNRVSLYSSGCPGTNYVDQAGLKYRNLLASASQSAGITGLCHHHPARLHF